MNIKTLKRNIPPERENKHDRFRVNYGDKKMFDVLEVRICRKATKQEIVYEFSANDLTDMDSIHFSTSVENNKMFVHWDEFIKIKRR